MYPMIKGTCYKRKFRIRKEERKEENFMCELDKGCGNKVRKDAQEISLFAMRKGYFFLPLKD